MSRAQTSRRPARQREQARRALAARSKGRRSRRNRLLIVTSPLIVVAVVLLAFVAVRAAAPADHSGRAGGAASAQVVAAITGVSTAVLDAAGAGAGTQNAAMSKITGPPLTADGKPRVLYVGAEYCPFCAAERWSLIVALSRFGTWDGLTYSYSGAAPEVYPNTPTFSFHGATYTSRWLSFTGVETATNREVDGSWERLDALSAADAQIMAQHNASGGIPYTNLAGRYVINGATYSPAVLAGLDHAGIAGAVAHPGSTVSKAVAGGANVITAALCQATGGQPANVCTTSGVTAAAKALSDAG